MKTDIDTLKDSFKIGYEEFESSRKEAQEVIDLLHNRHYTQTELNELSNRGQPAETYNVIKRFERMFIGYFSSVMNTMKILPRTHDDIIRASVCNDMANFILEENDWDYIKDSILSDKITVGLSCYYIDAHKTGTQDELGRDMYEAKLSYINPQEIVLDPLSVKPDYSDARFLHRFKWVSEDAIIELFGKSKLDKLEEYYNFTDAEEAEFDYKYDTQFQGRFKIFNNYLIVHSIIKGDKGKYWSVFWSGETELFRKEITHKEIKFPYRVFRTINSDRAEYYGLFREVIPSQKAINQAILQIQLMVNTNKVFVEGDSAGADLVNFKTLLGRVNAVIPVKDLTGIKIENMSGDIVQQYQIIDEAINRIQSLLAINDSFLGQASASDSGRKVKLQQNASVIALRYITNKIEFLYLTLGRDLVSVMKQYYTSHQMISVADLNRVDQQKWLEINKPFEMPTGNVLPTGEPETELVYEAVESSSGEFELSVVNEPDTDLALSSVNVKVVTSAYNDTDDIERVFMDSMLSGPVGNSILNASPQHYFKLAGVAMEATKTRNAQKVADILMELSGGMPQEEIRDPRLAETPGGQGGQPGALMSAAGLLNIGDPNQGKNTNSGPIPKGGR